MLGHPGNRHVVSIQEPHSNAKVSEATVAIVVVEVVEVTLA